MAWLVAVAQPGAFWGTSNENRSHFRRFRLDFRRAELEEDVTQVVAVSVFGGNKIIVPQDMPVTLSGFSR